MEKKKQINIPLQESLLVSLMWLDDDVIITKLDSRYNVFKVKVEELNFLCKDLIERKNYLNGRIEEILADNNCSGKLKDYCNYLKRKLDDEVIV